MLGAEAPEELELASYLKSVVSGRVVALAVVAVTLGILAGAVNWIFQAAAATFIYAAAATVLGGRGAVRFGRLCFLIASWLLMYGLGAFFAQNPYVYPVALLPITASLISTAAQSAMAGFSAPPRAVLAILVALLLAAAAAVVELNWLSYLQSPATSVFEAPEATFIDASGAELSVASYRGRVLVLDFWTTTCGPCYRTFPSLQSLALRYRDEPDVAIFAVNLPVERERWEYAEAYFRQIEFSVARLMSPRSFESVSRDFGFSGVPTVIVINRAGNVVFRGSLYTGRFVFVNDVSRVIQRELEE